jgi:hypothetical protein
MSDEIKRLIERAPFSFVGTILHLGAATMTEIPVDERTAVVHVDHVLHAPDEFARIEGHRITIQLSPDAGPPAVGQTFAFFAEGLAFGESIAVTEIGRLPVESVEPHINLALDSGATAGAFTPLLREVQEEKLREHMQQADAVVIGRVVKIEKAGPSTSSEHDPDWWRATIDVYHVELGSVQPGDTDVLFANSLDVRWYRAPKPRAAQGGVWILHRTPSNMQTLARFQIIHPEDYQATQQMDVLRKPGN